MSRETERVIREFEAFLSKFEPEDEEEMDELFQQFMDEHNSGVRQGLGKEEPEDAYDFLEFAENARTKKERSAYITRALELEPGNLDAFVFVW